MSDVSIPAMAKRLEMWPLERLRPYANNARVHSERQVEQIAASIREFGFTAPILVDSADGILAGHGRLQAAHLLGLATVPVVVLDHLDEVQRRAYLLADNRLAEGATWDQELLAKELAAIDLRHVFSLNMRWDDREAVLGAARMAKERWGLEGMPEALATLCREWMDEQKPGAD